MPTPLYPQVTGPVSSLVNYYSSGSTFGSGLSAFSNNSLKETSAGTLTAGVLSTVHSLTGPGVVNALTAYTTDTNSKTIRVVVIVDGQTIFDATTSAVAVAGRGSNPIGVVDGSGNSVVFQPIVFGQTFVVQVASSIGTSAVATGINYELWS